MPDKKSLAGAEPLLVSDRVVITKWDEQTISGHVVSQDLEGLAISLNDRPLSYFDESNDIVVINRESFSVNSAYIPAGCISRLGLEVRHSGGAISSLRHPDQERTGNAQTNSLFGGMWIDQADWEETLLAKQSAGTISSQLGSLIRDFVRDGYVVIPKAVSELTLAQTNRDIEKAWQGGWPGLKMEVYSIPGHPHAVIDVDAKFQNETHKLLDTYVFMRSAAEVAAAPAVVEFMTAVFEDQPKAFQQLTFGWGSQQAIHKDTAYVKIDGNPMSMMATWVALEDITEGTGELEYYVGSHKAPDYIFGGVSKWLEANPSQFDDFLAALHIDAKTYNHPKAKFLAKAGDVLIWHADLAHGGSPITRPGVTRKSIVTHFTAARNDPYYRRWSTLDPRVFRGVQFVSGHGRIRSI